MTLENDVAAHYTTQDLLGRVREALQAAGIDPDTAQASDLKGMDEFHTGGAQATIDLIDQIGIGRQSRVLDMGCGIGGAARHIASTTGAQVTGVDLTPGFIETGQALNAIVGLDEQITLMQGSVLDLPLVEDMFDVVVMLHVGMNVADKTRLFAEAHRVLAPGGVFALFDVMHMQEPRDLTYPVPWAEEASVSCVETAEVYLDAADAAGFTFKAIRNRTDLAKEFFKKALAAFDRDGGPPPLGTHLMMRETAPVKLKNYASCVEAGILAPFEMIFRKPA